jgi:hypothetical protein
MLGAVLELLAWLSLCHVTYGIVRQRCDWSGVMML